MDFLTRLISICHPPKTPFRPGTPAAWSKIELQLGTTLPADYKNCIDRYGAGEFGGDSVMVMLHDPFFRNEWTNRSNWDVGHAFAIAVTPYEHFPAPGGTLWCGSTDNADSLFWLTRGEPDEWKILAWNESGSAGYYAETPYSLTEFLYYWVTDTVDFKIFPRSKGVPSVGFVPCSERDLR